MRPRKNLTPEEIAEHHRRNRELDEKALREGRVRTAAEYKAWLDTLPGIDVAGNPVPTHVCDNATTAQARPDPPDADPPETTDEAFEEAPDP